MRALERDARARPDDARAGWAYVRALERTDRRAAWLELERLARGGDDEARARLEAWTSWPGSRGPGGTRRVAARDPRDVTTARLASPEPSLVAVTAGRVIVTSARELVALGADLAPAWRLRAAPAERAVVASGDWLVHGDAATLVLRDAATGTELARRALSGRIVDVAVDGDRGAAVLSERVSDRFRETIVVFDASAADFGRVIAWHGPEPIASSTVLRAHGGRVHFGRNGTSHALALEDGRVLWREPDGPGATQVDAADERGVVARTYREGNCREVRERSASSGALAWSASPGNVTAVATTAAQVFVACRDRGGMPVVALDRVSGAETWRAWYPRASPWAHALAVSPAHLLVASARPGEAALLLVDAATGEPVRQLALPADTRATSAAIAESGDGWLVWLGDARGATVVRLT